MEQSILNIKVEQCLVMVSVLTRIPYSILVIEHTSERTASVSDESAKCIIQNLMTIKQQVNKIQVVTRLRGTRKNNSSSK